ncbi:hypothetical protein C8R44DRAFT_731064 [Mycena epipterygia]|nr:hypothetical protein C8R44DRAFT_731064 [Mycena epipterygia]
MQRFSGPLGFIGVFPRPEFMSRVWAAFLSNMQRGPESNWSAVYKIKRSLAASFTFTWVLRYLTTQISGGKIVTETPPEAFSKRTGWLERFWWENRRDFPNEYWLRRNWASKWHRYTFLDAASPHARALGDWRQPGTRRWAGGERLKLGWVQNGLTGEREDDRECGGKSHAVSSGLTGWIAVSSVKLAEASPPLWYRLVSIWGWTKEFLGG